MKIREMVQSLEDVLSNLTKTGQSTLSARTAVIEKLLFQFEEDLERIAIKRAKREELIEAMAIRLFETNLRLEDAEVSPSYVDALRDACRTVALRYYNPPSLADEESEQAS